MARVQGMCYEARPRFNSAEVQKTGVFPSKSSEQALGRLSQSLQRKGFLSDFQEVSDSVGFRLTFLIGRRTRMLASVSLHYV